MRLRRSDLEIWDYSRRRTFRLVKQAVRDPEGDDMIAWALKRANARAAHAIVYRSSWLALQVALGRLALEGDSPMGYVARAALARAIAVHLPADRLFMKMLAERLLRGSS